MKSDDVGEIGRGEPTKDTIVVWPALGAVAQERANYGPARPSELHREWQCRGDEAAGLRDLKRRSDGNRMLLRHASMMPSVEGNRRAARLLTRMKACAGASG